jgi:hypothetical protein
MTGEQPTSLLYSKKEIDKNLSIIGQSLFFHESHVGNRLIYCEFPDVP